jgi:hypothetical protein
MKIESITLIGIIVSLAFVGCIKPCTKELRIGEIVQIPIQFNGFTSSEIDNIRVYRACSLTRKV